MWVHNWKCQEKIMILVLRFLRWVSQPIWSLSFGVNSEGNSTTTVHHVSYLKCYTGVIRINDSNIQHYSNSILESKQFMSTSHTLFYVSTSCIESENEVLCTASSPPVESLRHLGIFWANINIIIVKSIDLCISGNYKWFFYHLGEIFFRYQLFTNCNAIVCWLGKKTLRRSS